MLSKVLEKSTCAKCKFCCSFRRCSLWETPLFPENTVEKLERHGSYQFDTILVFLNHEFIDGLCSPHSFFIISSLFDYLVVA